MFKLFSLKKEQEISTKRGAMFGIDARITFAVTAIAAFIVGVNQFSDIERNNKDSAVLDLRQAKNSILSYYEDTYTMPANINTLITNGYLVWEQVYNEDPWGGSYEIHTVTQDKTIANALMEVKYVTLVALGKNGIRDITVPTNYNEWVTLEASGDDIITKFDTITVEEKIAETETSQLEIVRSLINNYIATRKSELSTFCSDVDNQRDFFCDVNEDSVYAENEEYTINFMPKDIDDDNGKYYIVKHNTYTTTDAEFKSGYVNTSSNVENNMYSFVDQIGGGAYLVTSPRGLILHFSSNKYGNTTFPYYAEVWYDNEVTVF